MLHHIINWLQPGTTVPDADITDILSGSALCDPPLPVEMLSQASNVYTLFNAVLSHQTQQIETLRFLVANLYNALGVDLPVDSVVSTYGDAKQQQTILAHIIELEDNFL